MFFKIKADLNIVMGLLNVSQDSSFPINGFHVLYPILYVKFPFTCRPFCLNVSC